MGHCIYGAAINGGEQGETEVANPTAGGVYNFAAAPTEDGGLIAAADDLNHTFAWRLAPGDDPSLTASWSGVRDLGAGEDTNVAGGPGGAYILNQERFPDLSEQIHVRRWEGSGFSRLIDVGARETGRVHDLTVGPSGEVAAVWRRGSENGEPFSRFRIARSTNQGASFSAPVSFATTGDAGFRLDAGLASDGGGFAVWQDEGKTVRAASLEPIAEFVAPVAPGPGPGRAARRRRPGPRVPSHARSSSRARASR